MKSKTKLIILYITCVCLVAGVIAGVLFSIFGDKKPSETLTDKQKVEKVLSKTSPVIEKNNKNLVDSYNEIVRASSNSSKASSINSYSSIADGLYLSSNEEALQDALWNVNYFLSYYVYYEYFYEYMGDTFLNNTIKIENLASEANVNVNSDIYAKMTVKDEYLELNITLDTPYSNSDDVEDMLCRLYFNSETFAPKKLIFLEEIRSISKNESETSSYKYARDITFDFEKSTFSLAEIRLPINEDAVSISTKSEEYILSKVNRFEYHRFSFNDFSTYEGAYCYSSNNKPFGEYTSFNISEEELNQLIGELKNIITNSNFHNFSNYASNFDKVNPIHYEKGGECILYGQNKYVIEPSSADSKYLVARQVHGIDSKVISLLEKFEKIYNNQDIFNGKFNDVDFKYNDGTTEIDLIHNLNTGMVLTSSDYNIIRNWLYNDYNENEFYFKEVKLANNLTLTVSNSCLVIRRVTETETLFLGFNIGNSYCSQVVSFLIKDNKLTYYGLEIFEYPEYEQVTLTSGVKDNFNLEDIQTNNYYYSVEISGQKFYYSFGSNYKSIHLYSNGKSYVYDTNYNAEFKENTDNVPTGFYVDIITGEII